MSTVVGNLQVDVTTGQAALTFDESKKQLDGLASSAEGAGQRMDYSMRESRESIMLTAEAMGVHLPAGITRVIASLGPLGSALAAALPVAAVIAGIVLIIEALDKLHAAQEKTKLDSENAGSAIAESLRGLDEKFIQAGIKADELRGNHLAALTKELKLIDMQTLSDLEHEFEALGKTADAVFADMKSHWYTMGTGSEHAKYNLDEYEAAYRKLLDTKGEASATEYLKTQLDYEQRILQAQKDAASNKYQASPDKGIQGDYNKFEEIRNTLKAAGVGWTDKEVKSQQELVDVLNAQVSATGTINATAKLDKSNDTTKAADEALAKKMKLWDEQFKAAMKYRGEIAKVNEEERKRADANAAGADKKNLEELDQWAKYLDKVYDSMQKTARAQMELNTGGKVEGIEEQIAAYKQLESEGLISQQQLAAKLKPLYQQEAQEKIALLTQELQMANDAELRYQSEGDAEKADKAKQDEIKLQADLLKIKKDAAKQDAEINKLMNADWMKMAQQMQTEFNSSVAKSIVEGRNFGQAMRQIAAQFLESMITSNLKWLESTIFTNQARVASGQAADEESTTSSLVQGLKLRFDNAKTAASKAFATVPFPFDFIVAPLVFAAALAFAEGGIVPGSGSGDTVPAMLTPGEAVLPKPMVAALSNAASTGGSTYHLHYSPNNHIKAWDGSDVKSAMEEHKSEFIRQVSKEIRRRHK